MESLLSWAAEIGVSDSALPSAAPIEPSAAPIEPSASPPPSCLGRTLAVFHFPDAGGRGLAAARDLRRGEMVLRVPRAALLTTENAFLRDRNLASCASRHPHLSSTQILIICLLAEVQKARESWWYPYLTQLPQSYSVLATFMEFETQAFQIADATWISDRAVSKAKMEWKQSVKLMEEIQLRSQLVSLKAWLWASATVSSRALHISWDSAGCLCPVGDLFNYDAPSDEEQEAGISCLHEPPDTSPILTDGGFDEALDSYCFYARKGYKKGEQVLLGYGTYTNLELLEHYGFLLNLNPNDKAFISLEAPIQVSDWPNDSLYVQPNGRPSFSLISALRLSLTPKILRRSVGHLAHSGNQLSVDNEVSVMRFLARCCQNTLQNLPTSVEDDILLLDGIEKSLSNFSIKDFIAIRSCSNEIEIFLQANNIKIDQATSAVSLPSKARRSMERWRLAVQWRVIYKTSLLNCISFCNKVINSLADRHL